MTRAEAQKLRANKNVQAFLAMIGKSEGANYRTLVNKATNNSAIKDLSKHPNIVVGGKYPSTAAGRYQFIFSTWSRFQKALGLPDFSEQSQDLAAIAQLSECGSLPYILKGDIKTAISKARKVWASFPGAGYGQGEHSLDKLLKFYDSAVGAVGNAVSAVGQEITAHPEAAGGISIGMIGIITVGLFFILQD